MDHGSWMCGRGLSRLRNRSRRAPFGGGYALFAYTHGAPRTLLLPAPVSTAPPPPQFEGCVNFGTNLRSRHESAAADGNADWNLEEEERVDGNMACESAQNRRDGAMSPSSFTSPSSTNSMRNLGRGVSALRCLHMGLSSR